ncbi:MULTISPECIES: fimbrial protein [Citrobacter]|uniref:fimbrial protein n=1 Tax=Citrobacter TaxID=544 RepID=UPI0021CF1045|nr:fimbrial protein [Citrobacter cronae]MCU6175005.1 fimbrial protein [Citrobacter cronae]
MKNSIICSAILPFLFAGMAHAADTKTITEEGQLVIQAKVEGSSCHFSSEGGNSSIIDMGTISTSEVYKVALGNTYNQVWKNDTDALEIICPNDVALKNIKFSPTNFSTLYPGLLQDDSGDATGVGFAVEFYNSDSAAPVKINSNDQVVDVSALNGTATADGGIKYTLKFDARWARLAQDVKAGDVKSTIKFTVETD